MPGRDSADPYRNTEAEPTLFKLSEYRGIRPCPHGRTFRTALALLCANQYEIDGFAREVHKLRIDHPGVCCGASPRLVRQVA